ncbi:sulfite exporter TauE/SafE family protein, partial [Candidatus Woesearchaeota archaeon]|nr:sulfite exporter TauE/SafE family protein [Candidatus Woesearchaeota archaeon]
TLMMPLALIFFDFRAALVLVAFFHVFGNVSRIALFGKVDWWLVFIFGLPSVLFSVFGASLVGVVEQDVLRVVLGAFLLVFSLSSLVRQTARWRKSVAGALIAGGASGFLAGLIGTGGAVRSAYLTTLRLDKKAYISTAAVSALLVDVVRIPLYVSYGFLHEQWVVYLPVLFVVALAGSYVARLVVRRVPSVLFRKVVLVAIAIAGGKLLVDVLLPLLF